MSKEKIITIFVDDDKKKAVINFLNSLNLTFEVNSKSEYYSNSNQSIVHDIPQVMLNKNQTENKEMHIDWWNELSPTNKAIIEKGILQLDNGKGISDSKVRNRINKLFEEHENRN